MKESEVPAKSYTGANPATWRTPRTAPPAGRKVRRGTVDALVYITACVVPLAAAAIVSRLVLITPFWDEWTWTDLIYKLHVGSLQFADLWQAHAGQRMLVPNVIALGLDLLGGWSQLREVLFSLLLIVLTQAGMFIALRRVVQARKLPYVFLAVTLLLYSFVQIENLDWGFQSAWFLCNACAVAVTLLLGTAGQSWFALVLALGAATVGSLSAGQGLTIWLAGLVTLLFTVRRRPAQVVAWIAAAALVAYAYNRGDGMLVAATWATALDHPLTTVRFLGAVIGSPLVGWLGLQVAVVAGWCMVAALVALLAVLGSEYRRDRAGPARAATMTGLAVYALAGAGLLSAERVGDGLAGALSSRYSTLGLYGWIAALVLGVMLVQRQRMTSTLRAALLATALVAAMFYAGTQVGGIRLGIERAQAVRAARSALATGGGPELRAVYPDPAALPHWLDELRAIGDGPYYGTAS